MSDFNQIIIEEGVRHWPVYAGVAVMIFAMARWLIPHAVKNSLENGGGDAVRRVISSELMKQDLRIDEKLRDQDDRLEQKLDSFSVKERQNMLETLVKHEEMEKVSMQNLFLKMKRDIEMEIGSYLQSPAESTESIEEKPKTRKKKIAKKR